MPLILNTGRPAIILPHKWQFHYTSNVCGISEDCRLYAELEDYRNVRYIVMFMMCKCGNAISNLNSYRVVARGKEMWPEPDRFS